MTLARFGLADRNSRRLQLAAVPLLVAGCLYGQSTNPLELLKQPTPPANERITYGKDPLQFGEIRVPTGDGPFPVAIIIHGGCWSAKLENLPDAVVSFELLRPIASALAESGVASWNIEYRRLGNEGGGWPGTYLDIGRATDLLRDIGPRYHLDLNRAVVIGHARDKLPKNSLLRTDSPLSLKGVIDIDGPPDLETFRAIEQPMCGGPVVTKFIGGTPAEFPNRYREGSVTGLLPTGVRQEVLIRAKPAQLSALLEQYVGAAEKAGDPIRVLTLKGNSHFDGINPRAPDWETVMASVRLLLRDR